MRRPPRSAARGGFTLAEVAVTLIIVGITLLWVLEGLNRAKMTAAHTHNQKMAAQLALLTLNEIEAGLYWEDLDRYGMSGNYAEEGYEAFFFEVVLGDETFDDLDDEDSDVHDSFAERRRRKEEERDAARGNDEDEDEIEEPYEKVKVRVTFPQTTEQRPEVVLERWVPWEQVYGPDEDELQGENA